MGTFTANILPVVFTIIKIIIIINTLSITNCNSKTNNNNVVVCPPGTIKMPVLNDISLSSYQPSLSPSSSPLPLHAMSSSNAYYCQNICEENKSIDFSNPKILLIELEHLLISYQEKMHQYHSGINVLVQSYMKILRELYPELKKLETDVYNVKLRNGYTILKKTNEKLIVVKYEHYVYKLEILSKVKIHEKINLWNKLLVLNDNRLHYADEWVVFGQNIFISKSKYCSGGNMLYAILNGKDIQWTNHSLHLFQVLNMLEKKSSLFYNIEPKLEDILLCPYPKLSDLTENLCWAKGFAEALFNTAKSSSWKQESHGLVCDVSKAKFKANIWYTYASSMAAVLHIFTPLLVYLTVEEKDELKIEFNKFSPLSKIQYEENTNKVIEAAGKSNLEYFDNIKVYKQYAKLIWDFKNDLRGNTMNQLTSFPLHKNMYNDKMLNERVEKFIYEWKELTKNVTLF